MTASAHPGFILLRFVRIAMLSIFLLGSRAAEKPGADLEYKIKAVMLLKLINYVDWPTNTFENSTTPFRIAILGADPFGTVLDEVLKGEHPKGRSIEIVRAKNSADCSNCQMVFIPSTEKDRAREPFKQGILTVSDIDRFARNGGMIGMVRDDKNVRFEVNIDACARAGLKINSRLSSFARVVTPDK
jgi:hypothetical protein